MNRKRYKQKRAEVITHSIVQYNKSLDLLIAGKCPPDYVTVRWQKLKRRSK